MRLRFAEPHLAASPLEASQANRWHFQAAFAQARNSALVNRMASGVVSAQAPVTVASAASKGQSTKGSRECSGFPV